MERYSVPKPEHPYGDFSAPQLEFELKDFKNPAPVDLSDGQNLALFLFRLKNGSEPERQRYGGIGEMFKRLTTGREFDVGMDDQAEGRNTNGENEKAIFLQIRVLNGSCEIPLAFSGAGLAESLFLSAIIEGTDNRVILLDEPALNLHPTTQSTVLKEIEARGQSQSW